MKYSIQAYNDKTKLEIFGRIGDGVDPVTNQKVDGFKLTDFRAATANIATSNVEIDINSPGGDPFEAFAIYDAIKAMNARVTANIVGVAASAVTIIAAAADRVTITENSRYLIHEASAGMYGKKDDHAAAVEMLEKLDAQMLAVYVKRTGKPREELEALMKKDTYLTASEALAWGFVDEIIETEVKLKTIETMSNKDIKVAAQAEEELEKDELEMLKAELAAMKDELEAARAALAEYKEKEEQAKAEQVEELVESAVQAGKLTAEAKAGMVALALSDYNTAKSIIEGIKLPEHPAATALKANAKAVVAGEADSIEAIKTKEQFTAAWEKGLFKGKSAQYTALYNKFYGGE